MPILFGFRRRGQQIGVLMWPCQRCGRPTAQLLSYIRMWFTLFFIPVIPLPTQRKLVCTTCGNRNKFDNSQRQAVEDAARAGAARSAAIAEAAAQVPGGPMTPPYPNVSPPPPPPEAAPSFPAQPPAPLDAQSQTASAQAGNDEPGQIPPPHSSP